MKQLTVLTENSTGVLANISEALAAHGINIETFDAESVADFGVLILTVDRYDEALQIINQMDEVRAITEEAIVIRLQDKPGALARIARRFKDAGISIQSMRILQREPQASLVAISTERTEEALKLVADVLVS